MDDTPFIVPAVKGIEATLRESLGSGPNREAKGDRVETRKMRLALAPKIAEVEAKSCATKEAAQLHQLRTKEIHAQVAACMAAYEEHQTQRNREINANPASGGRLLGEQEHGELCEIHALKNAHDYAVNVILPDDDEAIAEAELNVLKLKSLDADLAYLEDKAHTDESVFDLATETGHLLVITAKGEALQAASVEARRAVKVAEDGLFDLRARRKARDAARKATGGVIGMAQVSACVPQY
jgi:hypothetical protein